MNPIRNLFYRAYVKANGTGTLESTVKTFTGEAKRFNFGTKIPATLEAPATRTGFDIYAGLPDYLESLIESESPSWTEFQDF